MKLIYRITLRLSLITALLLAVWSAFFYFTIMREINDETDDALSDYAEKLIICSLAGRTMPVPGDGTNNTYSIQAVSDEYAEQHPRIAYSDADVYIPGKDETEPARILKIIFRGSGGGFWELTVATPTIEKDDLLTAIAFWIAALYLLLLLTVVGTTVWIFHRSMRPLYALLEWLDAYEVSKPVPPLSAQSGVTEFDRLSDAALRAAKRSEKLYQQQQQFLGNASHEMQTPLAICRGRLEWLVDRTELSEEQLGEIFRAQRAIDRIVKLNRTLLLLSRLDCGQLPESEEIDMSALVQEQASIFEEIYAHKEIRWQIVRQQPLTVTMNRSLAETLVGNLLKNAWVHSSQGGNISIGIESDSLTVSNDGSEPLDSERIFERFYQGQSREGSSGLGLSLVEAVCRSYDFSVSYRFENHKHAFTIQFSPHI